MKKRLLAIAAILAVVVGAIVLVFALLPARPGITKANFDRLEKGMAYEEVESIFGGKHAELFRYKDENGASSIDISDFYGTPGEGFNLWQGVDGFALIQFSEMRKIETALWRDCPTSLWQRLQICLP